MTTTAVDQERYFDLAALAEYSGMSVRTLHRHIKDPVNPLPTHYVTTSGKGRGLIRVSKREFDAWLARFPPVRGAQPSVAAAGPTSHPADVASIVASIRRKR